MTAARGPIFIGGCERSGKTLMRWLLSMLPDVAVSRRTEMWPRFYGRYGDLRRQENLRRCLDAMLARKQIAALDPDVDRIVSDFSTGPQTYARLFALIHEHHADRSHRSRWGDQTPMLERFASHVMMSYPGARFIHMVRDPRDCYCSVLDREVRRPRTVGRVTARWLTSITLGDRNEGRFADAYLVVRYEEMVTTPTATMRRVCAFLGETFDPEMVMLKGARRYDDRAGVGGGGPISTRYVGRYRGRLDPRDLAFIQRVAGRRMTALGYETDPVVLSARQRLHGTVSWSRALAGLGARLMIDGPPTRRPVG